MEWTKKAKPITDDIVLSRRCNPGESAFVPAGLEFALGQNLVLLRSDGTNVYPPFLRWLVRGPEWWAQINKYLNVGAVFDSLRCADILKFELHIPPLKEQRIIAEVLSALDERIDLNARTNGTLEQIAQTLFQAWFVDFLPVRAKASAHASGRDPLHAAMCALSGKDVAALDAMPREQYEQLAATAALFPDELVDSELGEVPLGWTIRSLPEVLEINPPRPLKKGTAAPYVDMASVPTNSARVARVAVRALGSGSKFRNGDTLLARITPCLENGKTAFVDLLESGEVGWGSTEFIVIRPKPPLPEAFAYFLCRDPGFRSFAIANMAGTTGRQRVPNDCFANYRIAVPDAETARVFGHFAAGCLDMMRARDAESQTLAELRDTLLPKLLSGEIRVAEARELAEAAA